MPRTIRFHLDENGHGAIAEGLRRRGIDITTTPEVSLLSATDEQQIAFALAESRSRFTQDRDYLRLDAAGVPHGGIAFCEKDHTRSLTATFKDSVGCPSWQGFGPKQLLPSRTGWPRGSGRFDGTGKRRGGA
jgi:hypothetical protein